MLRQTLDLILRPRDAKGRRLIRRLLRIGARHLARSEVRYRDAFGYVHSADLQDRMESLGYFGALLRIDDALPRAATELIRPGDWVIDVGANVGLVTAQLCSLVGEQGKTWAIEPIRRNVDKLQQLKDENRLTQLRVFEGALSDVTGCATLSVPSRGESGWGSFARDFQGEHVQVSTWRLDDLVSTVSRELRLIKIDVEGHEPAVLRGALATLQRWRPIVFCEFNDFLLRAAGTSSRQLLRSFAEVGYSVIWPGKIPEIDMLTRDLLLGPDN